MHCIFPAGWRRASVLYTQNRKDSTQQHDKRGKEGDLFTSKPITILPANKGRSTVVMDTTEYNKQMEDLLKETSQQKKNNEDTRQTATEHKQDMQELTLQKHKTVSSRIKGHDTTHRWNTNSNMTLYHVSAKRQ